MVRPMHCIFVLILALALAAQSPATFADEYSLPDPPGAMVFQPVASRTVAVPNEKIPATCETRYRSGMETAFQRVWAQCRQVGQSSPSDCQRALFTQCTNLAGDIQKLESGTCASMLDESDAIAGFQKVDSQRASQSSNTDLNTRAYVATQKVIEGLQASSARLTAHRNLGMNTMRNATCADSTSANQYQRTQAVVGSALNGAQAHLAMMVQAKQASAAQFAKNSGRSAQNLALLVSAAPKSTISSAASPKDTVITTISTTSTSTTPPPTGSAAVPPGFVPLPAPNTAAPATLPAMAPVQMPQSQVPWVPILAAGGAAAVLMAVMVSSGSPNQPAGASGDGSSLSGDGPMPSSGGRNPTPAVVPGGGGLDAWNITVDSSFTDQQRAVISAGLAKIPSCFRYKLQGLHVSNRYISPLSAHRCVAGQFVFGSNNVDLNPHCEMAIGVTVHEFFHVLGNRNDNELHYRWKKVSDANNNCAVTTYGATNFYENFAESGRLLEYPDSSAEAKNPGACVDAQIRGMGQVVGQCPSTSR